MVSEVKDPEFEVGVHPVRNRTSWAVKPYRKGDTVGTIKFSEPNKKPQVLQVTLGVAGLAQAILGAAEKLKDVDQKLDGVKAGTHSYLQNVLNNWKNELLGRRGKKTTAAVKHLENESNRPSTHPVPTREKHQPPTSRIRAVICCAVRMAGGWGHENSERTRFLWACRDLSLQPYNTAQSGECMHPDRVP